MLVAATALARQLLTSWRARVDVEDAVEDDEVDEPEPEPGPPSIVIDPIGQIDSALDAFEGTVATSLINCHLYAKYRTKSHELVHVSMAFIPSLSKHTRIFVTHPNTSHNVMDRPNSFHCTEDISRTVRDLKAAVRSFDGGPRGLYDVYCYRQTDLWNLREWDDYRRDDRLWDELKRELMARTWAPERHRDWCLSVDEQKELSSDTSDL